MHRGARLVDPAHAAVQVLARYHSYPTPSTLVLVTGCRGVGWGGGLMDREAGLGKVLVEAMQERGWTQVELARAIGVSQQSVSRWLNSPGAAPRLDLIPRIAAALNIPQATLLEQLTADTEGGEDLQHSSTRTQGEVAPAAGDAPSLHANPARDNGTTSSNTTIGSQILYDMALQASRFLLEEDSSYLQRVSAAEKERLSDLIRQYPFQNLVRVALSLTNVAELAFEMLSVAVDRREPSRSDYYVHAAIAQALLGKVAQDAGDLHIALRYLAVAHHCALRAGRTDLQGRTLILTSLVRYWKGDAEHAVRLAKEALRVAPQTGSSRAWATASAARAAALQGDHETARTYLLESERLRGAGRQPDELDHLGGLFAFKPPRQLYYEAEAAAWLGDLSTAKERATAALEAASVAADSLSYSDEAGCRAVLAFTAIKAGDAAGAAEDLAPVLSLRAPLVHGIRTSLQRLGTALPGGGKPAEERLRQNIGAVIHPAEL